VIYNCSAWGKSQPTPTICQPMTSYGALFGSVAGGSSKVEFNAKTNLLDFLHDDLKRLKSQVAAPERNKLDAHLKGYEDMPLWEFPKFKGPPQTKCVRRLTIDPVEI